jgi:hypothetical protein
MTALTAGRWESPQATSVDTANEPPSSQAMRRSVHVHVRELPAFRSLDDSRWLSLQAVESRTGRACCGSGFNGLPFLYEFARRRPGFGAFRQDDCAIDAGVGDLMERRN